MRKVAQLMGMPIIIDIPEAENTKIFEKAFKTFQEVDSRFSLYKADSELSRYRRGEVTDKQTSQQMRAIMNACEQAQEETDGYFSAYYDGKFDPTGLVKSWAIQKAGDEIEKQGFLTYCIGAGGDILAKSNKDKIWKIGLENPLDLEYLTSKVFLKNGAVASSGNDKRGNHIFNPKTGKVAEELVSISVVGPEIIKADVLATAAFAAGLAGLNLVEEQEGYEALALEPGGDIYMTSDMEALLR